MLGRKGPFRRCSLLQIYHPLDLDKCKARSHSHVTEKEADANCNEGPHAEPQSCCCHAQNPCLPFAQVFYTTARLKPTRIVMQYDICLL